MRLITTAFVFSLTVFALPQAASASHGQLFLAASQYRDAANRFERAVLRARCFDRPDEQLVERWVDATNRLRSAARRPSFPQPLVATWNEVQALQKLVAAQIFGHPRCPVGGEFALTWNRVVLAGDHFAILLTWIPGRYPRHGVAVVPVVCWPVHYHHHHEHHHHDHVATPDPLPTPLPYWHPGRTPYGRGMSVPKVDRVISAPMPVTRDSSDARRMMMPAQRQVTNQPRQVGTTPRKITTQPMQATRNVQIQRTQSDPRSGAATAAPSRAVVGAAKTAAQLMRR